MGVGLLASRVHILGIGGAGMSGIARLLIARGISVSGSDAKDSRRVQALRPLGASIDIGHHADNLDRDGNVPSVVVASTAISSNNPEIARAHELGIPVLSRATALAELMNGYQTISVAGTHGKTTTTSMTTVILQNAGLDPSFAIGSEINESGSNAHQGTGEWFVVEADESDGTFLVLPTSIAIVTNVEADHLNYWENYEAIENAFVDFALSTKSSGGCAVICGDDAGAQVVAQRAKNLEATVITYGIDENNDAYLEFFETQEIGACFRVHHGPEISPLIQLKVPGVHNALNATAAYLATRHAGVPMELAAQGLAKFSGTRRRFEFVGEINNVRVFDDYAHHPTEIDAVLRAARLVAGNHKIAVAFQAHHYYRTALFSKEFGEALGLADYVVVLEVFAPGETPLPGSSGIEMANHVPLPDGQKIFEPSWSKVAQHLASSVTPGDIIMTLGAGDIGMMGVDILHALEKKFESS